MGGEGHWNAAALRFSWPAWWIGLLAAALRVEHYFRDGVSDSPDALIYLAAAKSLLTDGRMPDAANIYMPLYPLLIAVFGPIGIIWFQILLSSATAALVYRLALVLWGNRLGAVIAGVGYAVYPNAILYSHLRLTETTFAFLVILALYLLTTRRVLLAAVSFVLANLCRPSLDYVLPLIMMMAALKEPAPWRTAFRNLAIYLAVYCVLMSPWWLHNYRAYGQFVRLNLGGGITAVLENSKSHELHGFDWTIDPPWAPYGQIADPVARDRAMLRGGIEYVLANPVIWLKSSVQRLVRMASPWEDSFGVANQIIGLLVVLCAYAGMVWGLIAYRDRWRTYAPALITVVWIFALHSATHALTRYRFPIDPVIFALSGGVIGRRHG